MLKKYHYIYKTTNTINNKFYVGMHSTNDLNDGYMGSGKLLRLSIKKHGNKKHNTEILEYLNNRELLRAREKEIVNEELLDDVLCMNLVVGGQGEGTWQKINQDSELQRQKQKKSALKQKWLFENDIDWANRKREKSSKHMLLLHKAGLLPPPFDWTGRMHTDETKRKQRLSAKSKHNGKKNSQYGTCWVYSLSMKKNKKIPIDELDEYILIGWCRGRKMKL